MAHLILLVPGFFGFAKLGGIRYFRHVEKVLERRFEEAGQAVRIQPVPTLPTGSIRKRAGKLASALRRAAPQPGERVHIVGHSTGGLDARLLVTLEEDSIASLTPIETVVTVATPHYGTPIASFFSNLAGKHLLFAVSLLMVVSMHGVGGRSYAWLGRFLAFFSQWDDLLGLDNTLLDYLTRKLLAQFDEKSRNQVIEWASSITSDRGAMLQITPEGMDIFNAAAVDHPDVRYLSYVTGVTPPSLKTLVTGARDPYFPASYMLFSGLYRIASGDSHQYPYPAFPAALEGVAQHLWGVTNLDRLADGVVPTRSQVWGTTCGLVQGDHLDVCGHFRPGKGNTSHTDWLRSGARFNHAVFTELWSDIAARLLERPSPPTTRTGFIPV